MTQPDRQDGDDLPAMRACVEKIRQEAFRIPPPNPYTPEIVSWCIWMDAAIDRLATPQPARGAAEGALFAWTIPGDDQTDCNGFIPTKVLREGEFTKPLYTAPPKPAPDAMRLLPLDAETRRDLNVIFRSAVNQRLTGSGTWDDVIGDAINAIFKLAAPVPPADGPPLKTLIDCAVDLATNYEPSGAISLIDSPSATGAAEPVAWRAFCSKTGGQMINPPATKDLLIEQADHLYAEHGYILQPLYAAPPVRGDREAIARIIDPDAYTDHDCATGKDGSEGSDGARKYLLRSSQPKVDAALHKADAILRVQPGADEREAIIEECAKILDGCAQGWNRIRDPGMANNARAYAKKIRALSRQAPHSSSEGGR